MVRQGKNVIYAELNAYSTIKKLKNYVKHDDFLSNVNHRNEYNGDNQTALKELDASLSLTPDPWAYYQRAKLLADMGEDDRALADCDAGLALDSEHIELKWLQGELKKPAARRFQGRNKEPPVTK